MQLSCVNPGCVSYRAPIDLREIRGGGVKWLADDQKVECPDCGWERIEPTDGVVDVANASGRVVTVDLDNDRVASIAGEDQETTA